MAERVGRLLAFEVKLSTAPEPTKGFWQALADVKPEATYIVAPVDTEYPLAETVHVVPPVLLVERMLLAA
ncbi:MAG: hypothetical protein LV473_09185 [Nitrospira sp.]|nr:hypothetical protein [Nitrospira sp.]